MTEKLDAIIFGATGFTGKYAVEHAVTLYKDLRWAVAGRNLAKLEDVLKQVGKRVNQDLLESIPIILADIEDEQSIQKMATSCKLLVNCCGPYDLYGEIVLKACIEAGTHLVDISAEPQYIDDMQLKYNELARQHEVYAISACGFVSIPSDMGIIFAEQNFPGTVNSIEMFWENTIEPKDNSSKTLLHYAAWETAFCAISQPYKNFKLLCTIGEGSEISKLRPKLHINPFMLFSRPAKTESHFLPFPSPFRYAARRSQLIRYQLEQKRPVQYEAYIGFRRFFVAFFLPLYLFFIILFAQISALRKVLLRYPRILSFGVITREGPVDENSKAQQFSLTFRTRGWSKSQSLSEAPKQEIFTRVSGYDPFYRLTAIIQLLAGKTILNESHKIPLSGGVLLPGVAFAHTNLIEELSKNGLKFEVLK